jgi:hypothetical protein
VCWDGEQTESSAWIENQQWRNKPSANIYISKTSKGFINSSTQHMHIILRVSYKYYSRPLYIIYKLKALYVQEVVIYSHAKTYIRFP